jgi:hypothetical protein
MVFFERASETRATIPARVISLLISNGIPDVIAALLDSKSNYCRTTFGLYAASESM